MITPRFDIEQDDEFLNIKISINNVRFSSSGVEVNINENVLIFHLSPYYLRLRFDHNLVDDERATANFIPGESKILIKAPKANKGEFFADLDLHTKLLARINIGDSVEDKKPQGSLIEEVSSGDNKEKIEDIAKLGENFDWEIEQVEETEHDELLSQSFKYGFNNNYLGLIGVSVSNGNDINDLSDPEHTNAIDRTRQRIQKENNGFDDEYFASEYITLKYGTEEDLDINRIKNILTFTPKFVQQYQDWVNQQSPDKANDIMPVEFTETEQKQMADNLPRKEYILAPETIKLNYITILNVLFSFNFENIENEGDHTSESVWTIGKLTPQIAGLDQQLILPDSAKEEPKDENGNEVLMKEVTSAPLGSEKKQPESIIKTAIVAGIKRSLCFPLHRNYELSKKAWESTFQILKGGQRLVIKNLLAVHELFRFHDVYYVYNKCLLDDLVAWFISQGNETVVRSLALELEQQLLNLTKDDIAFECLADVDMETGEPSMETVTVSELEVLSDQMYNESIAQ